MPTVNLTIDGKTIQAEKGATVIEAARKSGIEIPHYCYHPGLSIAGNCRMCLVEMEKSPKPVIACNTFVAEGMVIKTNTPQVTQLRRSVMEFLLVNHPLDCPTCDQAGECRLQDYYMDFDGQPSRFKEKKVEKDKMVDLGANVMLDCERCIACTRCIRVCKEVAGADELALANRGNHYTITTFPGSKLSNPYAGNTIDVCPVGALTNKDFRYKKRVWFLSRTPSICPGCSRGCSMEIHHEESKVYRIIARENSQVNKYWICDAGRYGTKFINDDRVLRPRIKEGDKFSEVSTEKALEHLFNLMGSVKTEEIAVVAHARETNETLKTFLDFAKNILGTDLLFYTRHDPPHPYFDDKLITADKNPNQAGVDKLGFKPLVDLKKAKGVLVLNDLKGPDLQLIGEKKIPIFALWAVNESPSAQLAQVVLPIPTFAEQEGSFTNVNGLVQKINRAFEPRGEAMLVKEYLEEMEGLISGGKERKKAII